VKTTLWLCPLCFHHGSLCILTVVPHMRAAAGRWDLHHAIIAQGGYKRVGDMLGWRPARCSTAPYLSNLGRLRGELEGLGMDLGLPAGRMPTRQQLVDAGQHTLAYVSVVVVALGPLVVPLAPA
jgi:hypothetical protein